ncbi:PQQ-like beta-propeller repeat protein [Glycomyces sp. A-F 0318]|uniref:outer membrane protein assembly factor BamB family protein n=1 Tax=Glycomyces amatae TaxID=2881355 RepID=UPI001E40FCB5|nr:PQQ-binding-like beta-propeller repeat protein [Glycomyces amatae]MCD0446959.1 PQQ-like beta-propeller repeat protein [Glycomyces amatae]
MTSDDDRLTLWRELRGWPRYVQFGFAGLAVAVVASMFVIEPLYEPGFPDESAWPEGELPDSVAVGAVDGAADETGRPGEVGVYAGDPLWTAGVEEEGDQVAQVDQGVLRLADGRIALERDGAEAWSYEWEEFGPEVGVAGGVVIVSETAGGLDGEDYEWPGRQDTVALDLDTGEEVWRDREASFVTVFADAVLMTECTGDQDDRVGDCTLYARDPGDLSPRWSVPTYASARVVSGGSWTGEPAPDRLLVESFPTGHDSRVVTVYEDGAALAEVRAPGSVALAGDTVVVYDDYDDNPADGCTAVLAGHRFGDAAPVWEIEAETRKTADFASCGGLPTAEARDGRLPLTIDGVPSIVDAATGEAVWEAPVEGQAVALDEGADVLVVADWEAGEDGLAAYDAATGEERWRASAAFGSGDRAWAVGATLWLYGDAGMWGWSSYGVYAYDLATGEGVALPGTAAYFAPGVVVTSTGDYDAPVLSAWPVEVW